MNKYSFLKWFLVIILILFTGMELVNFWEYQDKKLMSIEYCWDEVGNHYVAPNYNCK